MDSDFRDSEVRETTSGVHWGAFTARVREGRIVEAVPSPHDPSPSPLIGNIPSAVHHACRVEQPMVRAGFLRHGRHSDTAARGSDAFVPVGWDEALDLVAEQISETIAEHGNRSLFASSGWGSAGCFHDAQAQLTRFFNGAGGFVAQVTNYSFGAASVIVPRIVGNMAPVVGPLPDWRQIAEHTGLVIAFGGMAPKNSQVNHGGVLRHEAAERAAALRKAGVKLVSISPLRDDSAAALGAEWIAIRPNTDTALMLALAHTLLTEGRHDRDFVVRHCAGFDRLEAYLTGATDGQAKDARWASAITGVEAGRIEALARQASETRTLLAASWSVQRADHGEQPCWALIALASLLGQIGLPGGGFGFGYGAINGLGAAQPKGSMPRLPTGENAVSEIIPIARVTDMLLNPGQPFDFNGKRLTYPDARLVYWSGGNPFHKQQDLNRLLEAWRKPEAIIVHEPWWTPAARRADIVLPATTPLERNDIGGSAFDRYFIAQKQAIPPVGRARDDFEIFGDLADRLGFGAAFREGRDQEAWLRHLWEVARGRSKDSGIDLPDFDRFWEEGMAERPVAPPSEVPFAPFRADPAGHRLNTPSGRIELYSETIAGFGYDDCPGHPAWLEPTEWLGSPKAAKHPLHMVSNQPSGRLHSQMDCGEVSRSRKHRGREPIRIRPVDAEARGIADGDIVRVFNDRGACLAAARVGDGIARGVVQIATGAWFDPERPDEIGSLDKHGNPNVLTLDKGTSRLAQSCSAQTVLVEIERFAGDPPPVTAYEPPRFETR